MFIQHFLTFISVIIVIINDNNMTFHKIFHHLVSSFPLLPQYGDTPLHEASSNGNSDTVRTLIELGANVHSTNQASIIIIILLFLFLFLMYRKNNSVQLTILITIFHLSILLTPVYRCHNFLLSS